MRATPCITARLKRVIYCNMRAAAEVKARRVSDVTKLARSHFVNKRVTQLLNSNKNNATYE